MNFLQMSTHFLWSVSVVALHLLVRPHPVNAAHEDVAEEQQRRRRRIRSWGVSLKPGFFSSPLRLMEITGICSMSGLLQGPADEADVVGGTAAASGLGDDDCRAYSVSYLPESRAFMICPTTIREG